MIIFKLITIFTKSIYIINELALLKETFFEEILEKIHFLTEFNIIVFVQCRQNCIAIIISLKIVINLIIKNFLSFLIYYQMHLQTVLETFYYNIILFDIFYSIINFNFSSLIIFIQNLIFLYFYLNRKLRCVGLM